MKHFDRVEEWLTAAVSQIRFYCDKHEVREELAAHLEDKVLDLMDTHPDMTREKAEEMALARMGDPEEIGRELAEIHKPWVGYLWAFSVWAVFFAGGLLAIEMFFVLRIFLNSGVGLLIF